VALTEANRVLQSIQSFDHNTYASPTNDINSYTAVYCIVLQCLTQPTVPRTCPVWLKNTVLRPADISQTYTATGSESLTHHVFTDYSLNFKQDNVKHDIPATPCTCRQTDRQIPDTATIPCRHCSQHQNITCHAHFVVWQIITLKQTIGNV